MIVARPALDFDLVVYPQKKKISEGLRWTTFLKRLRQTSRLARCFLSMSSPVRYKALDVPASIAKVQFPQVSHKVMDSASREGRFCANVSQTHNLF